MNENLFFFTKTEICVLQLFVHVVISIEKTPVKKLKK